MRAAKALVVKAKMCSEAAELKPEGYVGYRLGGCSIVEHLLYTSRGIKTVRKKCADCVFGKLVSMSHVVGLPVVTGDGLIKFVVVATRDALRVLSEHRDQVVEVEKVGLRNVLLTGRQREALRLLADGAASSARLASALGVSKPAAWKLARKLMRKLALLHS